MTTTQENRLLEFELESLREKGIDFLLINTFKGEEKLSGLYQYEVELLHEENFEGYEPTDIDINKILGQDAVITIKQPDGNSRIFTGIVNSFVKQNRNTRFSFYRAKIVPKIWLLSQNRNSRIFQQKTVQEILEEVFAGFDFRFELDWAYEPRNYCVQYRESDFQFASRLLEEEGFCYYFEHKDRRQTMVIADTPQSHVDVPEKSEIDYQIEANSVEGFVSNIHELEINNTLNPGQVTLRDRHFQLPNHTLEETQPSFFKLGSNEKLEFYDFPEGYARKYDRVDRMGYSDDGRLGGLWDDQSQTAKTTMGAFDAKHEVLEGKSNCCSAVVGYRFKLLNHPKASLNRHYIFKSVTHSAQQSPGYISDQEVSDPYTNEFKCIAHGEGAPRFYPERKTPKPIIHGSQVATVVGPESEEIFTDKYGRVKVQFPWDRHGDIDENGSCWIRVSQSWAGNHWGTMFIPRVGMEVVVDFLEGDPDQPIISGCVYNPNTMPPYPLPDEKTKSTIKSDTTKGGGGFNEFRFDDKKDEEQIFIHGQKDIDIRNLNDRREWVGNDQHVIVTNDRRDKVRRDEHHIVERHQHERIDKDRHTAIGGADNHSVGGNYSLDVKGDIETKATVYKLKCGGQIFQKGSAVYIDATVIYLKAGGSFINMTPGSIEISASNVKINSGGSAQEAAVAKPAQAAPPKEPDKAADAEPGSKIILLEKSKKRKEKTHREGDPTKTSWIKIKLVDEAGKPVSGVYYKVTAPDGRIASGYTNKDGKAEVKNIDPGSCKVTFPDLDKDAWEEG